MPRTTGKDHARMGLDIWGDEEWLDLLNGANSIRGISRIWMLAHMPRPAYSGPIGARPDWRQLPHGIDGIYHLLDQQGRFIYIGKTCNPFQRFVRHREQKSWWPEVSTVNFYLPGCHDHIDEPCPRSSLEKVAFRWETAAIRHLQPSANVMGVAA